MAMRRTPGGCLIMLLAFFAGLAMLAFAGWSFASRWRPATEHFPIQGVDVSEEQGAIDWAAAKGAGIDFAYVRATRGAGHRDTRFEANWHGLAEAGIRRGAIHRFSLCEAASEQANLFVATVPRNGDALPAAIEFVLASDCAARPPRDAVVGGARTLIAIMERHLEEPVLLKIGPRFEEAYRLSEAIPRTLWASGFAFPPEYLARPWRMWQASAIRRVPGVDEPVNWDVVAP